MKALGLSWAPLRSTIRNRGTREKQKFTKPDTTEDKGKIVLGTDIFLSRLLLPTKDCVATDVDWENIFHKTRPEIMYAE
jgi:hypothetical protein